MWLGTLLLACRPDPGDIEELTLDGVSEDGEVQLEFEVSTGTALLIGLDGDGLIAVDSLVGPDGAVLSWESWVGEEQLTSAVFVGPGQGVLNWPVRTQDEPLVPGRWTVTVSVLDASLEPVDGVPIRATIRQKTDRDLRVGRLHARLLIPEGLSDQLAEGTRAATERWVELWGEYGLELDLEIGVAELGLQVPDLLEGDPQLRAVAVSNEDVELVAWVGEELAALPNGLGHAGSIPNARFDGPRAVLGLAALQAAGPDGRFSSEEIALFGEAMAHEAGHFLGLFHPVELDWTRTDALPDTAECGDRAECEATLGGNLMFPYPICAGGDCIEAADLSRGQREVLHGYEGVR